MHDHTPSEAGDHERPTQDLASQPTRALVSPAASESPITTGTVFDAPDPSAPPRTPRLPRDPPSLPRQLGRYTVLGMLGRGGMGTVLEAFDRTLDRRVALKVLHEGLAERDTRRLIREAQSLAKLSHPNVVQVYEVGESKGQAFIAMELVQGRSLREWLARDPRPSWRDCVHAFLQAAEGLSAAHAQGLVHRDFKPGNAVIDEAGRVRVLDFGLARQVEDATTHDEATADPSMESPPEPALTQAGTVMGTPAYMAPEQVRGAEADARSDQFAFCVALYEALYVDRPFEGDTMQALMASVTAGRVRPVPRGTLVPVALRSVVLRGLSADPDDRWPSMEALASELRRIASPRRRGWLALGLATGLTAIGLGIAQHAAVGYRCEGARAQLEGIWDPARAKEIEQAILGTNLSYAPETAPRVTEQLDAYASAWAEKHTEVCEATSIRQEQSAEVMDLRMACLQERRSALRGAVEVLRAADPTRVRNAVELVASLPGLSPCDDVQALRLGVAPPEDPDVAARVRALREQLAQAHALDEAGVYDDARAMIEAVVAEAEALAYPPLRAEALLARGLARSRKAEYAGAEQDIEQAYLLAAEQRHDRLEAEAVARLAFLVGHRQARHEQGLLWSKTALALAKSFTADPGLEAAALNGLGVVLRDEGKLDESLAHMQRALAIQEQRLGPDHPDVASLLGNIGLGLHEQGKPEQALEHLRRALAIQEAVLGAGHPKVASTLGNIGTVLMNQGALDESLVHHQRALAIQEQAFGPDHIEIASTLANIGGVYLGQSKLDAALANLQRAAAVQERTLGPEHPDLAIVLDGIGSVLHQQKRSEEALTYHRRALAIQEATRDPEHPSVAIALNGIGNVLLEQGKLAEAAEHQRRALGIFERALGPEHPYVAYACAGLAEGALAQGELPAAREHAERAIGIFESTQLPPAHLAKLRFVLARALWADRSQHARARALAQQARDAYAEAGAAKAESMAELDTWLAEHPAP
jgi:tetratricopeptide (TPR) repeat protein/predicted Ser/Thr protein kinase